MEITDRATEFVVFCIENTAMRLGISGDELYREMKRLNAVANEIREGSNNYLNI